MPIRTISFDAEAHAKIAEGVETIAKAVGKTMGPRGRAVAVATNDPFQPVMFTVDGVTVANHVELSDPLSRLGADAIKGASRKTNDIAGDGTTTAAVLAHAIYSFGRRLVNNGENPVKVKAEIERETKLAVEALKAMAIPVADEETLVRVATISSKDAELGKLVADVVSQAGEDGLVTVEAAPIFGVETEVTKGFKLDMGYIQPWMVTDPQKNVTVMEDAHILVTDGNVDKDIAHLMNRLLEKGTKRLVVIADGFSPDALATMYTNGANGKFVCVGIRAAGVGDHRKKEALRDLCAATGATLISEETGKTLKDTTPDLCGKARQVTVGKDSTIIVEGAGKQDDVDIRLNNIRAEMAAEKSEYNLMKFRERISRLTGIAGVIKVGGTNEAETKEKKQRVEDAVNAVKAAKAEGILPGGGTSLLNASSALSVLCEALQEPLRRIAENAGYNPDVVLADSLKLPSGKGLNVSTGEWGDLVSMGVIDPLKVTRTALENASSVATLLLVTDVLIVDEPTK
jgi:chaperonin GroEL